jgi:formate dehydrogenase major subunit
LIRFAGDYQKETKSIIIFSEKEVSANTSYELFNLTMITGKLGKASSGLISLKEKNNSQGLAEMGIHPEFGVEGQSIADEDFILRMKEKWQISEWPIPSSADLMNFLKEKKFKNLFLFGEDPLGCAINKEEVNEWLNGADFIMLQDYFMTETAKHSDLLLPASFPIESGGSFTNTQKTLQHFKKSIQAKGEKLSFEQLLDLHERFGLPRLPDISDIMAEAASLRPGGTESHDKFAFHHTPDDNEARRFNHGCDYLMKYFEDFPR